MGALGHLRRDSGHYFRVAVAVEKRPVAHYVVDDLVAVQVVLHAAVGSVEVDGEGLGEPVLMSDAAGKVAHGLLI